jgi:hypothetical protein
MKIGSMLLLFVLLGCQDKKNKLYNQQPNVIASNWNPYSTLLIGKWTQCSSTSKDGVLGMTNVCKTWIFSSNGSLWMNTGEYEKWKVRGDTLYLNASPATDENGSQIIVERYQIIKSEDENTINLDLKHLEGEYVYTLIRDQPYQHLSLPVFNITRNNSKD